MKPNEAILFGKLSILWPKCAVCHSPGGWRGLQFHHLVGAAGRKHDRRNLLRLCGDCHDTLHFGPPNGVPDLTKGMLLTVKQEVDPKNYDPEFLASLVRKKWLGYDPEPLADYYIQRRVR